MTALADDGTWKHCNICKKPIPFRAEYFVCSVSTCTRKRTGLFFCSLPCFEAHLPMARHRDAWAQREQAPSASEWRAAQVDAAGDAGTPSGAVPQPERGPTAPARDEPAAQSPGEANETETLIVVSKLKKYVRDWSGMNTSDAAMGVLSDHLRELCREATRCAGMDGRRTVLDRDFTKVLTERREAVRRTDFDSRR
jgi:histone H3/H4